MTLRFVVLALFALTGCKSAPRPPAVAEPPVASPCPKPSKDFGQLPTETPVYAARFFPTPTPTATPTPKVGTAIGRPPRVGWAAPRATETPEPKPTPELTPGPVEPAPPPLEPSRTVYLWRVIVSLFGVLFLLILARIGKNKSPGAWVVLLLLLAPVAHAGGPDIWSSEGMSWTGTTLSDAGTRTPTVGARTEYRLRFLRAQLAVRVDFLAEKDGVDPANPGTYSSIEAFTLASYRVAGPVAVSGIYGVTRPAFGIDGQARSTWAAGALLGDRERWVFVGCGVRRAVSDDLSGIAAWRWRVKDRTSFVGDLVAKQQDAGRLAYQARVGVAVSLWGRP